MPEHALDERPLVVGIGGTVRSDSSSEAGLRSALAAASAAGARTLCLTAHDIALPFYEQRTPRPPQAVRLVEALRSADGLIVSSPGYHGSVSGLVKNALDYAEDLAGDARPYLDGIPVGCIGVAYGKQAAVAVIDQLRTVAHALRGFPTPYGAAVVAQRGAFRDGRCVDPALDEQFGRVGAQVAAFAGAVRTATTAFEPVA
ncbi:NADPH-dependent FMN reductase [Streptomyces viridosporus]|uniref:NADPH-dependent FMN reductase n=1 Tax=Streptomyces viridosporus TaxID=67581 RepID=UPI0009BD26A1|nr:NADPH-dependent FMN reductase [Streptomyces viridosporus]